MSKIYSVSCKSPTPLAANPWECFAESEVDAIDKFMRRNGITATDHQITVEVTGSPLAEDEPTALGTLVEVSEVVAGSPKSEADHIREYLVANPDTTNKNVVASLKEQGVDVTSSQVASTRK